VFIDPVRLAEAALAELDAIRSSSPDWPQHSLLRAAEPTVLFCPDLVWNHGGKLHFVTAPGQEVSAATLRSVERLTELPFSILCFAHGEPLLGDPHVALLRLLDRP
jgi:glyoxylase-like metal-dependent hydrolase (beta-lactamase superfamily II)